jgi:hypothetical protein
MSSFGWLQASNTWKAVGMLPLTFAWYAVVMIQLSYMPAHSKGNGNPVRDRCFLRHDILTSERLCLPRLPKSQAAR